MKIVETDPLTGIFLIGHGDGYGQSSAARNAAAGGCHQGRLKPFDPCHFGTSLPRDERPRRSASLYDLRDMAGLLHDRAQRGGLLTDPFRGFGADLVRL
jgi:hypothetical protein